MTELWTATDFRVAPDSGSLGTFHITDLLSRKHWIFRQLSESTGESKALHTQDTKSTSYKYTLSCQSLDFSRLDFGDFVAAVCSALSEESDPCRHIERDRRQIWDHACFLGNHAGSTNTEVTYGFLYDRNQLSWVAPSCCTNVPEEHSTTESSLLRRLTLVWFDWYPSSYRYYQYNQLSGDQRKRTGVVSFGWMFSHRQIWLSLLCIGSWCHETATELSVGFGLWYVISTCASFGRMSFRIFIFLFPWTRDPKN